MQACSKARFVVDVDGASESATVIRGATPPFQVDVIGKEHGDGTEVHLTQCWGVKLEAVPKHQGMACCRTAERGGRDASWTVGLDEHWTMLDEEFRQCSGAFVLQDERIDFPGHQRLECFIGDFVGGHVDRVERDGILSRAKARPK